jgi:hypothetical protein
VKIIESLRGAVQRVDECIWQIPPEAKAGMLVPASFAVVALGLLRASPAADACATEVRDAQSALARACSSLIDTRC